jgi:hypothetical protein
MAQVKRSTLTAALMAVFAGAVPVPTGSSVAQTREPDPLRVADDEIIVSVNPYSDIVVNGRAIRCRPAAADPLDAVRIPGWNNYVMIVPDGAGGFVARRATELITGPDFWQRVGIGLGSYQFRSPRGGRPMCVGGRGGGNRFAGFRRVVDATEYRGKRVRFSAWVATRSAEQVNFWLAVGSGRLLEGESLFQRDRLLNGGNTNIVPFSGSRGWTPVLLELGPLDGDAGHISYGLNLEGSGDLWVHDAKLEVVADHAPDSPDDNLFVIGRSQD